jgi:predicted DNA-binding transcriptional regulator YafY
VAIAVGLRTATGQPVAGIEEAAVRALTKLEQVLPSRLRHRVRTLSTATVHHTLPSAFGASAQPEVDPEHLTLLAAAIANTERVRFRYRSHGGGETRRHADPHRLVTVGRRWYLVAFDNDRADWRIYRVDRISRPEATGARITPRELPESDAGAFVQKTLFSSPPTYQVVATVRAPYDVVRGRFADGEVERVDDDTCRVRGQGDTLEWIAIRLILLGRDFEVHEPPELVGYVRTLGDRLGRATLPGD